MSLLLASGQRNTEKRSSNALCGYCDKVFNDPRALGGHLKAHRGQTLPKKNLNGPITRPRSALSVARPTPRPLKPASVEGSAGGSGTNQLAASGNKKPPLIPKKSRSELRGSNKPTPKITTNTNYHDHYSDSDKAKASLPVQAPEPSSLTKPSNVSLNYSSPSCFGVVYHPSDLSFSRNLVNGDRVSGYGSLEIKYPNKDTYAIPIANHMGSYRWPGIPKNTMIPYQDRFLEEHGKYEEYNNNPVLAPRVKKPYPTEASVVPVMMYPPRRMECNPMIAPEIHPSKEAEAEAEVKTGSNLDLSLHL